MSDIEIPDFIGEFVGYHSHIYFDHDKRDIAVRLNDQIQDQFKIWDYRWLDEPNGLHPTPFFRFAILKEDLARYVEFVMRHREGLTVLIHGITNDAYLDHTYLTMWLGEPKKLGVERMKAARDARLAAGEPQVNTNLVDIVSDTSKAGQVRFQPGDDTHNPEFLGQAAKA